MTLKEFAEKSGLKYNFVRGAVIVKPWYRFRDKGADYDQSLIWKAVSEYCNYRVEACLKELQKAKDDLAKLERMIT